MTQEDKAKRYDEVLKRAKQLLETSVAYDRFTIEKIFPELKESEDEQIRKELLEHCINRRDGKQVCVDANDYRRWADWLEKQGEQKYIPKYKIGDYVKNTNYKGEPIYEIVYMDKECYICEYRGKERMEDKAVMHFSFDNPYLRLVQKPTDKVEPKFEIGDEIKTTNEEPLTITKIDKKGYWSEDLFICSFDDADKWELVEQKSVEMKSPEESLGIDSDTYNKIVDECIYGEQKPAWSEEDEVALGDALWAIQQARTIAKNENDMGNIWYAERWLKSLKERYTWKPSDEQLDTLQYVYRNFNPPLSDKLGWNSLKTLELMCQDLKKLKG